MSSYYHRLLEQRENHKRFDKIKGKFVWIIIILIAIGLAIGGYMFLKKRHPISLALVKPQIQIQIADSLTTELKPKIDKFAQENEGLNIFCDGVCQKPDILFDNKKDENYTNAELIGYTTSSKSKYKFKKPDTFELSGVGEIWLMDKTGGKLIASLKDYLKSYYSTEGTRVMAVGDIMLSRTVDAKMAEAGNYKLPFLSIAPVLKDADFTFGNLESPFYNQGAPVREGMVFKADPRSIAGLVYGGIDLVTLANNHFGNQGQAGMLYTFSLLTKNKIDFIGAGKNLKSAQDTYIKEINGTKFAFIGVENYSIAPVSYYVTGSDPGLLHVDATQIKKYVTAAKKEADVVVVTFHGGTEYQPQANQDQINFAHAAIDAGADIVIGHHPHVVENVENYKGKMILYSLGNFVFDQMWSVETQQGLTAKLYFKGSVLYKIKLIPVRIHNFNQPQVAEPSDKDAIINRILKYSNL